MAPFAKEGIHRSVSVQYIYMKKKKYGADEGPDEGPEVSPGNCVTPFSVLSRKGRN
jgi:hypothetical protein